MAVVFCMQSYLMAERSWVRFQLPSILFVRRTCRPKFVWSRYSQKKEPLYDGSVSTIILLFLLPLLMLLPLLSLHLPLPLLLLLSLQLLLLPLLLLPLLQTSDLLMLLLSFCHLLLLLVALSDHNLWSIRFSSHPDIFPRDDATCISCFEQRRADTNLQNYRFLSML